MALLCAVCWAGLELAVYLVRTKVSVPCCANDSLRWAGESRRNPQETAIAECKDPSDEWKRQNLAQPNEPRQRRQLALTIQSAPRKTRSQHAAQSTPSRPRLVPLEQRPDGVYPMEVLLFRRGYPMPGFKDPEWGCCQVSENPQLR